MTKELVDFLDLDTSKITLLPPKPNKYGGSYVPLRYDGKNLNVRYKRHVTPFGIRTYTNKDGMITGYSTSS